MCVYNAVNGVPGMRQHRPAAGSACATPGASTATSSATAAPSATSCAAITSRPTIGGAAVAAVKAGTDLTCGTEYKTLVDEVKAGTISEAEITARRGAAVRRALPARHVRSAGAGAVLDDPDLGERLRSRIGSSPATPPAKAIVLLKNEGGLLPLASDRHADRGGRAVGERSGGGAGQLQRHLVEAGHAARGHRAAVPDCRPSGTRSAPPTPARRRRSCRRRCSRRRMARVTACSPSTSTTLISRASRSCAGAKPARTSRWRWSRPRSWRPSVARSTRSDGRRR